MDYVVGSVAALVSGNVTPNRPRLVKRALTPTKHQPSPNVTPKSELVDDRSIFLSPSMQKKKAVVKKSPKRIFQNPDLETTDNGEGSFNLSSPKADKVKKHLQDDLDNDTKESKKESISSMNKGRINKVTSLEKCNDIIVDQNDNENTPTKKKKKMNSFQVADNSPTQPQTATENLSAANNAKKRKKKHKSIVDDNNKVEDNTKMEIETKEVHSPRKEKSILNLSESTQINEDNILTQDSENINSLKKKKKLRKKKAKQVVDNNTETKENIVDYSNIENTAGNQKMPKKKNKKHKKSKQVKEPEVKESEALPLEKDDSKTAVQRKKIKVNPNAVTDKDSDSEHESDDDIESENDEINKKVFESEPAVDESSDEDDKASEKEQLSKAKVEKEKELIKEKSEVNTEDEIKRTLFVGNVPFSTKCKKEIKKIFNKHGKIETIRIRTVPVKDGRYTPKLAVIKNELHPERTTVNVYIKYADEESVEKALSENNTVLNDHHLRVSRSSHTGAEHDPKCSIFVGNLPFAMEDEVLREKFENCGQIDSVRIIRDKKTNAGKGFGYVNFASKDGVELALALTEEDLTIKNRIIRVKRCTQLYNKQKQTDSNKGGFNRQFNQRPSQGHQRLQGQDHQRYQGQGNQRFQGHRQDYSRANQGFQRGPQGGQRQGTNNEEGRDGAYRRIIQKRKNQDGSSDGPPNKKQNINQPHKEKKSRKEFVGMTAEKKKKRKFDKGQKKKKALSQILTK